MRIKREFRQRNPECSSGARLLAFFAFALALIASGPAAAHMGSKKSIAAAVDGDAVALEVEVDRLDAQIALGLGLQASDDELRRHGALVSAWLSRGLHVASAGGPCDPHAATPGFERENVTVTLDYLCPTPAGTITLTDDTIFDDDPGHETFVNIGGRDTRVLRGSDRSVVLSEPPRLARTIGAFVVEGAIHLVTGYDHMLFLLSLILAAGLIARRRGLRAALRDVAIVVTAFTVGHSISLIGASLDLVTLPSRLVETMIAASIVAVAAMGVFKPEAKVARPWVAGVFGVVHGFGFSSVLAEVGLPVGQRLLALLSFNIGIELAQLAFVAIVLLPLTLLAGHRRYRLVVLQGGSLAIAAFGFVWLVERGLGL